MADMCFPFLGIVKCDIKVESERCECPDDAAITLMVNVYLSPTGTLF